MDEERFNRSVRRFLKTLGVNAQREIETAVHSAERNGVLPEEPLQATAEIQIGGIGFRFEINETIETT